MKNWQEHRLDIMKLLTALNANAIQAEIIFTCITYYNNDEIGIEDKDEYLEDLLNYCIKHEKQIYNGVHTPG